MATGRFCHPNVAIALSDQMPRLKARCVTAIID